MVAVAAADCRPEDPAAAVVEDRKARTPDRKGKNSHRNKDKNNKDKKRRSKTPEGAKPPWTNKVSKAQREKTRKVHEKKVFARVLQAKHLARAKTLPKTKAVAVAEKAQPAVGKKGPKRAAEEEELPSPTGQYGYDRRRRTVKKRRINEAGKRHPSRDEGIRKTKKVKDTRSERKKERHG